MKNITIEYMEEKYRSHTKIFTDGSKLDEKCGSAFYCEKDKIKQKTRISDNTAIATAELIAIKKSIEHIITHHNNEKIAIATDSLSAIQALKNIDGKKGRNDLIQDITLLNSQATDSNSEITIVWIPSHIGIPGNEIADQTANEARDLDDITEKCKLGVSEMKSIINKNIRIKLMQEKWNNTKKCKLLKQIMPIVPNKPKYSDKTKLITKLRLNVPNFFIRRDRSCLKCKTFLSPYHALIECQHFNAEREKIQSHFRTQNIDLNKQNILTMSPGTEVAPHINNLIKQINRVFSI